MNTTDRIKVVLIVNELLRGGAQRIVADLGKGIDSGRFDVTIVPLKSLKNFPADSAELEAELRAANVRIVHINGTQRFSFSEFMRLVRLLRSERPDIVHTFLPYAGALGRIAARSAGVRNVVSTQCNLRVAYDFPHYWLDRLTLVLASVWLGVGEGVEVEYGGFRCFFSPDALQAGRRHFTVSSGVDLPAFDARVAAADKNAKRNECGIPSDVPLLLSIARMVPWKGNADLIAAMHYVPAPVQCAIVGWGAEEKDLKKQAQELGLSERVHFLGARNDVPELLKMADLYVQAHKYTSAGTTWQGPNISQMEACAAHLPSVSTSVPYVETLLEEGITAKLAKPNDPQDLARAIQYIVDHPEEARVFARNARKRVEEKFSVAGMVRTHEMLYRTLVSNGKRSSRHADA